jgi:hypothetical protein
MGEMEGYCSTGQSPQRAVVPMEEEEELDGQSKLICIQKMTKTKTNLDHT